MLNSKSTPSPQVGESFAYIPPGGSFVQPVRAEVVKVEPYEMPSVAGSFVRGERVHVLVHYPDGDMVEESLLAVQLMGRWDDLASLTELIFEGDDIDEIDQVRFAPKKTWAELAKESYIEVIQQRKLAQRLTKLGIHREAANYAGRGGSSTAPVAADARLNLTPDELDWLITMAERGGASYEGH